MGWEALGRWGDDATRLERLSGGVANDVWSVRVGGRPASVVHGDLNPGNIRLTADRVALIDWDESHADVPDLDLVLPHNAVDLADDAHDIAGQASSAWQAAVCWDDDYSRKRLAEVRPVTDAGGVDQLK